MCAQIHIIFFARRKQGSKNEWRKTYKQTFGQTRGPCQPIQPQPYNSIILTRRNEMGWGSRFVLNNHLASVLYAGSSWFALSWHFILHIWMRTHQEKNIKKNNYIAKFCLQTFGGSKLGSIKLEAGAEAFIECKFWKMKPSHSWKKTTETWKTAKHRET